MAGVFIQKQAELNLLINLIWQLSLHTN